MKIGMRMAHLVMALLCLYAALTMMLAVPGPARREDVLIYLGFVVIFASGALWFGLVAAYGLPKARRRE